MAPRVVRLIAVPVVLAGLALAPAARADRLSTEEELRLAGGESVIREETIVAGEHRFVGGVTYTVLDTTTGELAAMFDDEASYRRVLPRTRRARFVGMDHGDRLVELTQGTALVQASYTIRVRREGNEFRFWMEPGRAHDIDDAWGFFRLEPFQDASGDPKLLLTYGVLVDVGPGLVRDLFEERVRTALLSVPQLVRRHVAALRRPQ